MKSEMARVCASAGRSWAARLKGPVTRSLAWVAPRTNTAGTATTAPTVTKLRLPRHCSIATGSAAPKVAHIIVTARCG